jgi:hypothetical protein
MAVRWIAHPSTDDRKAMGLVARDRTALSGHPKWRPAADRPDPVGLLAEQDRTREPDLVPVGHGRMMVSPFTFCRGAAKIMAADLAETPAAGLEAQLRGNAQLSNSELFASPERVLLFDVNDFDETPPGSFEYDVKRMAASFAFAGRNNGFSKAGTRATTLASVAAYREAMAGFAQMPAMEIWYVRMDADELMDAGPQPQRPRRYGANVSGRGTGMCLSPALGPASRSRSSRSPATSAAATPRTPQGQARRCTSRTIALCRVIPALLVMAHRGGSGRAGCRWPLACWRRASSGLGCPPSCASVTGGCCW